MGFLSSLAQETPAVLPANYKVVLDEPFARVIRVHYAPHEKVSAHDHPPTPTVYVYLNDSGPVRFVHEEGGVFTVVRQPTHTGAFRVNQGTIERHSVENLGDQGSDFLRVELVGMPLGNKELNARGPAPSELSHSRSTTEFAASGLSINREICVGKQPCPVKASDAPSVLVAFSNLTLVEGQAYQARAVKTGDVLSVHPQERLTIAATPDVPAQVLLIRIHNPALSKP